jgi:hypothetical protein
LQKKTVSERRIPAKSKTRIPDKEINTLNYPSFLGRVREFPWGLRES